MEVVTDVSNMTSMERQERNVVQDHTLMTLTVLQSPMLKSLNLKTLNQHQTQSMELEMVVFTIKMMVLLESHVIQLKKNLIQSITRCKTLVWIKM
jgi:hypothetical protein